MPEKSARRNGRSANTERKDRDPNVVYLTHSKQAKEKTTAELNADVVVEGTALNAGILRRWVGDELDLTALVGSMDDTVSAIARGDMQPAEALLMSQAVVLNAIF